MLTIRSLQTLFIVLVVAVSLLPTAPPRTVRASEPAPGIGDLILQWGYLPPAPEYEGCDCSGWGVESDRLDFVNVHTAEVNSWETGFDFVSGMDATDGNGVYLSISEPITGGTAFAARIDPATGEASDHWYQSDPEVFDSRGIATVGPYPVVGGHYYDGDDLWDVFMATNQTSRTEIEVDATGEEDPMPNVLGVAPGHVVYKIGTKLRLAELSSGTVLEERSAPWMRDGHMTDDGQGIVVAPGRYADAELISFVDDSKPLEVGYDLPLTADCPAVSADSTDDKVYILTACEGHDAEIFAFTKSGGEFIRKVAEYTWEEVDTEGSYPVRLRVYGSREPDPVSVIYVHGITTDAGANDDFVELLTNAEVFDNEKAKLVPFHYWQDDSCDGDEIPSVFPEWNEETDIHMASQISGAWNDPCDSQSSIGQNAILLHEKVKSEYAASGRPVIIIAYSMGASIARGMLSYSVNNSNDGVATRMIDAIFTIAGAHDGSRWPACAYGEGNCDLDVGPIYGPVLNAFIENRMNARGFDESRPAGHDLVAGGNWYDFANSDEWQLPGTIAYYNAYADIDVRVTTACTPRWLPDGPLNIGGHCDKVQLILDFGDGILAPGTNYPYDTPESGGARFSRPGTREQWQWQLFDRNNRSQWHHGIDTTLGVLDYELFHDKIPQNVDTLRVQSCSAYGGRTTLLWQLQTILEVRLGHTSIAGFACYLHDDPE